jgi:WD40 repeat protein
VEAEFPQGDRITGLAVSPDGRSVAVTVIGANVRVLSARDGKVTHDTGVRHGNALQPSFSPDGSRLSFFVREKAELGWVHRFHLPTGRLAEPLKLATTSRAWLHDNRTLAVGYADGAVRLHDGDSGEVTATLSGHTDAAYALAVSPDGGLLASGARDGTIRLWDLATRQERLTLRGHTGLVIHLAFRPDGKVLASSCLSPDRLGGGEVLLWETE